MTTRGLVLLVMIPQVYGNSEGGSDGWEKDEVIQLVALLVGIPAVIAAVIACAAYFKRRCLTDEESSDQSNEADSILPSRRRQDVTYGGGASVSASDGGEDAVVLTRFETHGLDENARPRRSPQPEAETVQPQICLDLQHDRMRPERPTCAPASRQSNQPMASVLSNTVAATVPLPTLHVTTHMRSDHTIASAAEDGESIRDFVIWFQREYERANSQIMGERDAWGAEMHRGAGGEPSDRLEAAEGWELGQRRGGSLVDGERDGD